MANGLSLHIGLNRVDPGAYGGWSGQLAGCVNDAQDMQALANANGYRSQLVLNEQATSGTILDAITSASRALHQDDILLITYSGHGGQVPDTSGTEPSGFNSTWVLFDRMVVDDELYALWAKFAKGVRIVVVSDSCHSGTVTRDLYVAALQNNPALSKQYGHGGKAILAQPLFRNMPADVAEQTYAAGRPIYDAITYYVPRDVPPQATVLLLAACQDTQLAADGVGNGLFTENLLAVWGNGVFRGKYSDFLQTIAGRMPVTQVPNYYVVGTDNREFETQEPFVISSLPSQTAVDVPWNGAGGDQDILRAEVDRVRQLLSSDVYLAVRVRADPVGTLEACGIPAADVPAVLSALY